MFRCMSYNCFFSQGRKASGWVVRGPSTMLCRILVSQHNKYMTDCCIYFFKFTFLCRRHLYLGAMSRPCELVKLTVQREGLTTKISSTTWIAGKLTLDMTITDAGGVPVRNAGTADLVGTGAFKYVYALRTADLVVKQRWQLAANTEWEIFQALRGQSGCERIARCYGEMVLDGVHYTVMEYVPLTAHQFLINLNAEIENSNNRVLEGLLFVKELLSLLFEVLLQCNMIPWDFATQNFGFKNGKVICFDYDNWTRLNEETQTPKVYIWKVYDRLARDLQQQPMFCAPNSLLLACVQELNCRVANGKHDYVSLD